MFSPPAWGWPAPPILRLGLLIVFPTRVGMARFFVVRDSPRFRFPHPRGDGPQCPHLRDRWRMFSPPAWGWPALVFVLRFPAEVFPTRVGMARQYQIEAWIEERFPHPRGDGPSGIRLCPRPRTFSPPAWGWPARRQSTTPRDSVFPTRVGMARSLAVYHQDYEGFPHPRGDGPRKNTSTRTRLMFSPPAWGWPERSSPNSSSCGVFPTRVGMARNQETGIQGRACFPHPRGDGPYQPCFRKIGETFSPPAWGWPADSHGPGCERHVFPTRVGMARCADAPGGN